MMPAAPALAPLPEPAMRRNAAAEVALHDALRKPSSSHRKSANLADAGPRRVGECTQNAPRQRAEPPIAAAQHATTPLHQAFQIPGSRQKCLGQPMNQQGVLVISSRQWWGSNPSCPA